MLPSRKNYQNTKIDCKKCKRSFRFNVCKTCLETIHEKWTDLKNGNWQNHKCIKP